MYHTTVYSTLGPQTVLFWANNNKALFKIALFEAKRALIPGALFEKISNRALIGNFCIKFLYLSISTNPKRALDWRISYEDLGYLKSLAVLLMHILHHFREHQKTFKTLLLHTDVVVFEKCPLEHGSEILFDKSVQA